MSAAYEVYEHAQRGLRAAPRGFNWLIFVVPGPWALSQGIWLPGFFFCVLDLALFSLAPILWQSLPVLFLLTLLLPRLYAAFCGNSWLGRAWQRGGFLFLGLAESENAAGASRNVSVSREVLVKSVPATGLWIDWFPYSWRSVLNIARLTVRSAVRYRIVQFLTVALMALVISLPILLRHDGTARGLTQIVLTYSMGSIITILVIATFWLAVGNLAREVEDGQMQMVCSKPIASWRIIFGKWLGIMVVNGTILFFAGTTVQFLLQWRAQQLPPGERQVLQEEILTARAAIGFEMPDFDRLAEEKLAADQNRENFPEEFDREAVLAKHRQDIINRHQAVLPLQQQTWIFPLGSAAKRVNEERTSLRVRFQAAGNKRDPVHLNTTWYVGEGDNRIHFHGELTTDTFHEIELEPGLVDAEGNLKVQFINQNRRTVVFDLKDGPELLYVEAGFETNVFRAFAVLFCWLGLGAAVGITAASKLNFNVATFFTSGLLVIGLFSGTISIVSENGTIWAGGHHGEESSLSLIRRAADAVLVPMIQFLNYLLGAIADYSPIESLSLGRSVGWFELGAAFLQCWLIFGSLLAALAIYSFGRRELANPWQS